VAVERADAETGPACDLFERRLDAPLGEHVSGGGDQQPVVALRVATGASL
jgi:hypothetical protein